MGFHAQFPPEHASDPSASAQPGLPEIAPPEGIPPSSPAKRMGSNKQGCGSSCELVPVCGLEEKPKGANILSFPSEKPKRAWFKYSSATQHGRFLPFPTLRPRTVFLWDL